MASLLRFSPPFPTVRIHPPLFSTTTPPPLRHSVTSPKASNGDRYLSSNGGRNQNQKKSEKWDCPVPLEQQPVREYEALASSALFSWAAGDVRHYGRRLAAVSLGFAVLLGWPVARFGAMLHHNNLGLNSLDSEREVMSSLVGSACVGLFAANLAALRMYLGWAYVGNRLLSATVEYEETGWYDGQIWVKPPEILARDRLLGSYSVKPILNRVKLTLMGITASLVLCVLLYISLQSPKTTADVTSEGAKDFVSGVYSESSARLFEPDAFCGVPDLS
ncbi:uncharacterized protein ycf36 [Amborella trichopoda]|uniref:DUF1230 family protein n=1 Tax=Amborella trichopoda TaxID=13333 RepID=U5DC06_AMBTC|nr:uncharacterized protein ycf36 [Amborella trichopoda]ERN19755.1 hypothetical protein AMTR_s00064p00056730 [Amborella trichopoda]|eukprot:XP_006858288.1 uncharacterized protein ycf36 [Amborella trichopoda]